MKSLFSILFCTAVFSSLSLSVRAQNNNCYLLDADGNSIDLGYLCKRASPPSSSTVNTAAPKKRFQVVKIKSRRFGIPVIDVKFNDKYTFEMMLDTGASSVVITEKMAQLLRVKHTETVWVSTPSSNRFKMPSGRVYSIRVGDLVQKNTRVITSPSMDMGLLGQSFFSHYDMTIKSDAIEFRER